MSQRISKKIQARDAGIDFQRPYTLPEALTLIKERAMAKFDETVEVVFKCNVDPQKSDQNLRAMIQLPEGTGKPVRVAVFAEGDAAKAAKEAGADLVGFEDLMEQVQQGIMDFDVCICVPHLMPQLSKVGKILGPRGLMPNPKLGTVTDNVAAAVKNAKAGQVRIRAEKEGIVHAILGKVSFSVEALIRNFEALHQELLQLRPATLKGALISDIYVSSTMGFALKVDTKTDKTKGLAFGHR